MNIHQILDQLSRRARTWSPEKQRAVAALLEEKMQLAAPLETDPDLANEIKNFDLTQKLAMAVKLDQWAQQLYTLVSAECKTAAQSKEAK